MTDLFVREVQAFWRGESESLEKCDLYLEVKLNRTMNAAEVERFRGLMRELHRISEYRFEELRAGAGGFYIKDVDLRQIDYWVDTIDNVLPQAAQEGAALEQENARLEQEVRGLLEQTNRRLTQKRM